MEEKTVLLDLRIPLFLCHAFNDSIVLMILCVLFTSHIFLQRYQVCWA